MKAIIKFSTGLLFVVMAGIGIVSCEKTFDEKLRQSIPGGQSSVVQIYLAMVNATRNHIYIDGNKVTGPFIASGALHPGSGPGMNISGGFHAYQVRDTLAAATQIPFTFTENMAVGGHQTVFVFDTITSPRQKTVVDLITTPKDGTAGIRFANFVYNPFAIPALDIYSARLKTNIFVNVQVTDVTNFVRVPAAVADTFYLRNTGTAVNLQFFTPTPAPGSWSDHRVIITPTVDRSYTLAFRGSYRTTTSTSAVVRSFTVFTTY